jgi:hypothetical protein
LPPYILSGLLRRQERLTTLPSGFSKIMLYISRGVSYASASLHKSAESAFRSTWWPRARTADGVTGLANACHGRVSGNPLAGFLDSCFRRNDLAELRGFRGTNSCNLALAFSGYHVSPAAASGELFRWVSRAGMKRRFAQAFRKIKGFLCVQVIGMTLSAFCAGLAGCTVLGYSRAWPQCRGVPTRRLPGYGLCIGGGRIHGI